MDKYRNVARQLQRCDESRATLRAELMSKELLVVWIAFCLVHHSTKNIHPLFSNYSVPLRADDMCHLVLSEKSAVNSACRVSKYIRENATHQGHIFSLLRSDKTMEFALMTGNESTRIGDIWRRENQRMQERQTSRWEEIQRKNKRLLTLDRELEELEEEHTQAERKSAKLYEKWEKMNRERHYYVSKNDSLLNAENEERELETRISSKKDDISRAESAPPPILQPLPSNRNLATKVLFLLNMPSDLQILSRLSFAAQQMLLPCQNTVVINTSPDAGTADTIDIDDQVKTADPKTLWYDYYVSGSTARENGRSAVETAVILGSSSGPPHGKGWYSSNVRNISVQSDGVWYPDSMEPRLFWNGGGCHLDSRQVKYFDPFRIISPLLTMYKFTENQPDATADLRNNTMQWALFQQGEYTPTTRGNFGLSSQDGVMNWPSKNAFLDFCAMRAYPLQQLRRLCATLSCRGLPLMNKKVRILIQQTFHQLGQVSHDTSTEREWRRDMDKFDGWASLRTILNDLCEELRSKSREHSSILTVGELAAQASQWDHESREVSRKFARIAEEAADELAEQELNAEAEDGANLRARRCILYMSCLACHSAGDLSRNDVAQICKALVLADYTRLFEDPTSYDAEIRDLTSITMSVMAARMSEVFEEVRQNPQILTDAVRTVHEPAPLEMSWGPIRLNNGMITSSRYANGADGHEYFIDLQVGTVFVDGRPPSRLPNSILSSPLYKRSFRDRNFEVVRKRGGILATTRRIGGYFYEFSQNRDGVFINEIDGSDPSSCLELLDGTKVDSWGIDLPKRLKEIDSHWLCREKNTILLRPKYFRERTVHYVLTREEHDKSLSHEFLPQGGSASVSHASWTCFRIPLHLRNQHRLAHHRDLSNLDRLVHLTDATSKLFLRILGKFESSKEYIHTFQTPQNTFRITLPRYGLEFELTDSGYLQSNSFSSYKLCDRQNFDDTLTDFSQYLILESQGAEKVLIPVGDVCKESSGIVISGSNAADANRRFHAYSVHPRFKTLDAVPGKVSVEARLQLGALYTATGTMLPEKRIGMTGGEHAIELMRQSWQSRPLTKSETDHLLRICSFGQLYPTFSLLAYELFSSAQQLSFLPFDAERTSRLSVSLNIEACTEYVLRKKRFQINPRALLTEDEEDYLLGCGNAGDGRKRHEQGEDIEIRHQTSGSAIMGKIKGRLKGMLSSQGVPENLPEFPFQTNAFGDTSISTKIEGDLRESWNNYVKLPAQKLTYANYAEMKEQIQACLVSCTDSRNAIEQAIHLSLDRVHGNRMEISCFNIRRAANLEARGTPRDLLKISCDITNTELFNPFLTPESCERIRFMILEWMQLCVMEDKLGRMLREVKRGNKTELIRELNEVDRSWDITKHPYWLAFEVEQQLQIRDLQYRVADFCLRNNGRITQLNMGEGKTRVIVPMLILELTKREHLMRIHLLSPLLSEAYDFLHHTITASVLNRRLLRVPFHRDVKLNRSQAVKLLHCLRRCQNNGGAVCIAPEHRLSLLLKKSELEIQNCPSTNDTRQVLQQIYDLHYFDLFDESDELLHHRYQLIYAVGACIPLSSGKERWIACQAVLQQLQANEEVAAALEVVAKRERVDDRLPGSLDNIRLLPDVTEEDQYLLAGKLATALVKDPPYEMRWLKGNPNIEAMVSFVTYKDKNLTWFLGQIGDDKISEEQKEYLLALRGILAYGMLSHCISLRHRVDYGIDPRRQTRRVAVPYRGSDMPSDRAEFAHPDILILFTHLAYYYKGLSKQEVTEAVHALLKLGPIAQREAYNQWLQSATSLAEDKRQLIDAVAKLDFSNDTQMTLMHEVYQHNMAMISFWLDACVLPKETLQFPRRLTGNAFHLTDNKEGNIIGFSGTKDNSILLPVQVTQELPDILQVKATDGKMLDLILTSHAVHCLPSSVPLPEAVLNMCLEKQVSALIDAGALMAGLENDEVAKRMVRLMEEVDGLGHRGVVYFEKNEASWMVLSTDGREWPLGNSPIRERDAFVYFDESHCRGADMKLRDTASALLTVGPDMCKDKIMQAAGRMRKLDRGQSLLFAVPSEIAMKIPMATGSPLTSKEVLQWVIGNTVKTTAKGLISWGSQGSLYCTTQNVETRLMDEVLKLDDLYSSKVEMKRISEIVAGAQRAHRQRVAAVGISIKDIAERLMGDIRDRAFKYGEDQNMILSQADEECEREIECERELEQQKEVMISRKNPCSQEEWDFNALLHTSDADNVVRLTKATSICLAMKSPFKSLNVDGIVWDKCKLYLTRNFRKTVQEEDGSLVDNLSNYLRPVDTVIFFGEGRCCLLLSEWEADKVLRRVWKFCEEHGENKMRITYANFTFLFPSDGSQTERCHLCIPRSHTANDVLSNASEHTLAGLQLFGGQTMFCGDARKAALREMLISDQAKRSALRLARLRGSQRMIPRSDLEDICSQ